MSRKIKTAFGYFLIDEMGFPISSELLPDEYSDVEKIDVRGIEAMYTKNHVTIPPEFDIMEVGYWTTDGKYVPPVKQFSENGSQRHIWNGRVNDD